MAIFLKSTDVIVSVVGNVVKYTVRLSPLSSETFLRSDMINKLNAYLSLKFCSDFVGNTEDKTEQENISLLSDEVYEGEIQKLEYRTIKVDDIVAIDDPSMGDTAVYLVDLTAGTFTVCGTVTDKKEKEGKNGKPFLILEISDKTDKKSGVYFSRKNYDKIRSIEIGEAIIARCTAEERDGKLSLKFEKINRCVFPENFVMRDKYKKSAPKNYRLIFPSPASNVEVKSIVNMSEILPDNLTENTFVVFDLETTGINLMNNGITEIGAVKIINGEIKEQFTTLVKPDYHINDEIVEITGINDEMVKDSPKINAVIPDFIKFTEGAVLVAQNASFDMGFIRKFAHAEDYAVENEVMDTMEMSRELLPFLKRNDLHTLAEHFGIVFHHHRALSDAYPTAQIFIELMKIKEKKSK
ncbi:MAG: 3'-5' exoribonuclease [Clostridia bacterium]|nr:3'-5' exoribonuclease [Clostridia bacterium]